MIFDKPLTFSDRQHLLATGYSTDSIDLAYSRPLGDDHLGFRVSVLAEAGTDPTLSVELQTSSDNSTFTTAVSLNKPAGKKFFGLPLANLALGRYVRLRYVLGGTSPEYTITSGFLIGEQADASHPDSPRIA